MQSHQKIYLAFIAGQPQNKTLITVTYHHHMYIIRNKYSLGDNLVLCQNNLYTMKKVLKRGVSFCLKLKKRNQVHFLIPQNLLITMTVYLRKDHRQNKLFSHDMLFRYIKKEKFGLGVMLKLSVCHPLCQFTGLTGFKSVNWTDLLIPGLKYKFFTAWHYKILSNETTCA